MWYRLYYFLSFHAAIISFGCWLGDALSLVDVEFSFVPWVSSWVVDECCHSVIHVWLLSSVGYCEYTYAYPLFLFQKRFVCWFLLCLLTWTPEIRIFFYWSPSQTESWSHESSHRCFRTSRAQCRKSVSFRFYPGSDIAMYIYTFCVHRNTVSCHNCKTWITVLFKICICSRVYFHVLCFCLLSFI